MTRYCLVVLMSVGCSSVFAADYTTRSGQELYGKFCASCHGAGAMGDGPIAKSLKVRPADLTLIAQR